MPTQQHVGSSQTTAQPVNQNSVFIRDWQRRKGWSRVPGIDFNLTDDGNFDLDGKRLTDVADPVDDQDATTKNYFDSKNIKLAKGCLPVG